MAHVILNGLKKELKYTVYALCELGRALGQDIDEPGFASSLGYHKVLYLLWAGLLHETQHLPKSRQLTFEQVMAQVTTKAYSEEFNEIRTAVVEAFLESQGIAVAEKKTTIADTATKKKAQG